MAKFIVCFLGGAVACDLAVKGVEKLFELVTNK